MEYEIININAQAGLGLTRLDRDGLALLGPIRFTCELVDEDGRILAVEVDAENTSKGPALQRLAVRVTANNDRLRTDDLRIPVDRILKAGARGAFLRVEEHEGHRTHTPIPQSNTAPTIPVPSNQSRRKRYGDDHYREIADDYRTALLEFKNPIVEIMEKHFMSRTTASRHVREARDRDFLGEALENRAGEVFEETEPND